MNNFITMMLTLSVATTLLFGIITCMEKLKFPIYNIYILNKIMAFFYLVPVFIVIYLLYKFQFRDNIMLFQAEDFVYLEKYENVLSMPNRMSRTLSSANIIAFIIWCVGFLSFFVFNLVFSMVNLKALINNCKLCTEDALCDLVDEIRAELHIKRHISLYQSDLIKIPFATGFFKMKVVIPTTEIDREDWRMLLTHELVHCKRHDVFMKTLVRFVQKVNWFNPCIYLFSRKFTDICEFTCDLEAVKHYDREQIIRYGDLLIDMSMHNYSSVSKSKVALGFSDDDYKFLERRIKYIMIKQRKVHKIITILTTLAIFIVACPMVTYASAKGITVVEDKAIKMYSRQSEASIQSNANIEMPFDNSGEYLELGPVPIQTRGSNPVDFTLESSQGARFNPITLYEGSTVRFAVYAGRDTDLFGVGYTGKNASDYIISNSGGITKTFTIPKDGTYTIYFNNLNDSSESAMTIRGEVQITY